MVLPTLIALPTLPPELMLPVEIAPFAAAVATPPLPAEATSRTLVASPLPPPPVKAVLLLPALASGDAVPALALRSNDCLVKTSPPEMVTPQSSCAATGVAIRPPPTSETATAEPRTTRESFT